MTLILSLKRAIVKVIFHSIIQVFRLVNTAFQNVAKALQKKLGYNTMLISQDE